MLKDDMKIIDIVYKYPQTEEIFKKYDKQAGCCVLCQHLFDTVNELAVLYKLNLEDMISNLETAVNNQINTKNKVERIDAGE